MSGGARYEREQGYDDPEGDATATRNNGGAFVEGRATLANRHYIAAGLGFEHNESFGEAVTPRLSIASYLRQPSASGPGDTKLVMNAGTGIKAPALFYRRTRSTSWCRERPRRPASSRSGPSAAGTSTSASSRAWPATAPASRLAYFHNTFHDLIEFLDKNALVRFGVPPAAANATDVRRLRQLAVVHGAGPRTVVRSGAAAGPARDRVLHATSTPR